MVILYLETVDAPSIYFQYAILRVHENLNDVRLIDIADSMIHLPHLNDDEKMLKVINRVQTHIELTHESLLLRDVKSNLRALMSLYNNFALWRQGTIPFWKKIESMLEKDLKAKKY